METTTKTRIKDHTALNQLGISAKRIKKQEFLNVRAQLDPILKRAGIQKPNWTMGSAGFWAPEHPYYAENTLKIEAGDIDIMIDAGDLMKAFPPDIQNLKSQSKFSDLLKNSKQQFSKWLTANGISNTGAQLNLGFKLGNDDIQVDLIVKPDADVAIGGHQLDYSQDPGMKGCDLWLTIWPTLIKMNPSPISGKLTLGVDKNGETVSALQLSPDRGVVDRETNQVIISWKEKDKIAELMVGAGVTGKEISSISGLKTALKRVSPEKWNKINTLFSGYSK